MFVSSTIIKDNLDLITGVHEIETVIRKFHQSKHLSKSQGKRTDESGKYMRRIIALLFAYLHVTKGVVCVREWFGE